MPLCVVEASIAQLRAALESGETTSVELVAAYLDRIAFFDRQGIRLNAVPVLNPQMFAEARASDDRRADGRMLGPLDGIPYSAKDSYAVRGLTVASGSPAFAKLIASDDAFTIGRLRAAGAVFLGRTNMPPMANGGMQRGVYGRAESPYNGEYLTSAFGSGSSNGSGTATGASFCAFGLAEETWSSGRAPASNNGLVAYTPSRGVISARGNWPLVPSMDVVVPHTRSVDDLLELLDVIVADDLETRGDFWRVQGWVEIAAASEIRPASYSELRDADALRGKRLGVPRMYIGRDDEAPHPIKTRPSVIALWTQLRADLNALGAEIVEVDLPVVSNYERDRRNAQSMFDRGIVPPAYFDTELWDLSIYAWNDFLDANADPALSKLADVEGALIFPHPTGALADHFSDEFDIDLAEYVTRARRGVPQLGDIPLLGEGLRGLEETRRIDFEHWLTSSGLDAIIFPAVADIGPADADVNPQSAEIAWRNGVAVANGNLVWRHLGIPTVTVTMGVLDDIRMPVGATIAGPSYSDSALLSCAWAIDTQRARRRAPSRTPELPSRYLGESAHPAKSSPGGPARQSSSQSQGMSQALALTLDATVISTPGIDVIRVTGETDAEVVTLTVNGEAVAVRRDGVKFTAEVAVPASVHTAIHSEWRAPYGSIVSAVVTGPGGCLGAYVVVGGIG